MLSVWRCTLGHAVCYKRVNTSLVIRMENERRVSLGERERAISMNLQNRGGKTKMHKNELKATVY